MIQRTLASKLKEMSSKFPVIAITGPRQSGKTTLCKALFEKYRYVSLENPDNRQFALEDPKGFLSEYDQNVVIDEVQNVPELFSYIQEIVDSSKQNGQFILTGSQNFKLVERITQTLAGRVYISHLLPFSQEELRIDQEHKLETSIFKGGYPRIYDQDIDPIDFFPSYIQTYLERDVRSIINIQNINLFNSFLKLCAGRVGQLFNASSIGNELGLDNKTVERWLSLLETSFVAYRLQPWHVNFNKRIVKTPKLYFYDTGIACNLLSIQNENELNTHFAKGSLFENYVINEHLKNNFNKGIQPSSYFWRDNSGNEIDLLIEKGKNIIIAEIKSGKTIKTSFYNTLNKFEKWAEDYTIDKYVVYGGTESQKRTAATTLSWNNISTIK